MKATPLVEDLILCTRCAVSASFPSTMSILSIRSMWSISAPALCTSALRARYVISPASLACLEVV